MSNDDDEEDEEKRSQILDEMTQKIFGSNGATPTNPFAAGGLASNRPKSRDLYSDEELMQVLNAHNQLTDARNRQSVEPDPLVQDMNSVASLHDMVLQSLNGNDKSETSEFTSTTTTNSWLDDKTKQTMTNIRAIASDVDGTLLSSRQSLHPRTRQAVRRAVDAASSVTNGLNYFFPATGKSRKGALDSLGIEIGALLENVPGVFLQGLYCVDGEGNVLFEKKLSTSAIAECEQLALSTNVSVVAYDGDDLYSTELTPTVVELHERYGEPMAQLIDKLANHGPSMHKILLMDDDTEKLDNFVRPQLEALAQQCNASVTQAIPTMLEWLPADCSKALGVAKVCEALDLDPKTQLLAIGDAENDATMLEMAAIGVAVANACPVAKEAADFVMDESNDEGGAGCAMELFGFGQTP